MSARRTTFGLTWWGQRWIAALEALGAVYANRLPRGRTYARAGRVFDVTVDPGTVTARVQGSRARPYRVALRLPPFDDAVWERAVDALAGELRHAAALLDGRMPEDVDDVLGGCGLSLFPRPRELSATCSCPDDANPCKHVAAVHYVLAQTFDADPFLLPTLRGRDRDALLAALRAARAGDASRAPEATADTDAPVPLAHLVARDLFTARAPLAAVALRPRPPERPGAVLRRLGSPPGAAPAAAALGGLVEGGAAVAWGLLVADHDAEPPVVAELHRRGPTSARDLATALDLPLADLRAQLRPLLAAGTVTRTGHARSTRYHA